MDKILSGVITLAIVGKPNVGKSTFFNKVLNKDLSPVSEIPGTTTDLFIDNITYKNRTFKLIDSGGLKRKGKSKSDEQQYITKESLKAIYLADVVLFMIEADKEFTKTDKQICRLVLDKGKGLIFVINKIDLVDELKKYSLKKITSIPTVLTNKTGKKDYPGNTKIVLGNPINSLIWLLNEIRKNNMILSFDFWVTTGSSTPIIPIKKGDLFSGSIKGLGSVSIKIN